MTKKKTLKSKWTDYLYDHPILKGFLHNGFGVLICTLSAFLFAFGFKCFIAPDDTAQLINSEGRNLVSGGVSGISQTIIAIIDLASGHAITGSGNYYLAHSILYFVLNIPVFIIAWGGIGKRFAILTFVTVGLSSLFTNILSMPFFNDNIVSQISKFVDQNGALVTRALLGGVFVGVSSAIAYKVDASAGGIDVIAYYVALKKSTLVGRYSALINAFTVALFTIITIFDVGWGTEAAAEVFVATLLSVLYMFVTVSVIDVINLRNKKVKVEVVSELPDLAKIIIANLPHGATLVKGQGAFTGNEKYIIAIVVSSYEVKQAIRVIREADPKAFVSVIELNQVYGRFYLPPIR